MTGMMETRAAGFEILLIEDSPGDVRLTQEALKDANIRINLHTAWDGIEAMDFLNRGGRFGDVPRPDLILLDLNLPRKDGREVLKEIKEDQTLMSIPVVILTTSSSREDIQLTYRLHGNSYICKPVDLEEFLSVIGVIDRFWLSIAQLPNGLGI